MSASTQNQAFSALLFLYREVLGRELTGLEDAVRAKRPARLPLVLTPAEVTSILGQMRGVTWLMASLTERACDFSSARASGSKTSTSRAPRSAFATARAGRIA